MAANDDEQQPLHILFFPYIAPGHLIPVADMAALLASRGVKCTILTTPANAAVIRSAVDRANAAADAPAIDISTVPFPDIGLPPGVESVVGVSSKADMYKLLNGSERLREPFDRFLAERRPDAVVAGSFFPWAADAAAARGVPRLSFLGTSMLARACTHALLRHTPLPLADVVALPGLPHRVALRQSQLTDPDKHGRFLWSFYELVNAADARSYGEVFNSFADLEPRCVDHYRAALGRRVWLAGPVAHARTDDDDVAGDDERCLRWLDGKPRGSVVYLSFGTLAHFSPAERRELARGLQLSGKSFLWVTGGEEDTDASPHWMPEGFAELVAAAGDHQRGLIFRGWAPQTRILNHPAMGAFVTHCGWNSVLEAVSAGVPMVTWPRYTDQFYNEKLIVEVLEVSVSLGSAEYASKLEARDSVISGETITEAIGGVMGDDEVAEVRRVKVKELGAKASRATEKGGSSYEDVGRLIQELLARRALSVHNSLRTSMLGRFEVQWLATCVYA